MSQWIKKLPSPYLSSFILVWAYFAVYSGSSLAYFGLGVSASSLFQLSSQKKSSCLGIPVPFVLFFLLRREMAEQVFRQEPPSASSVQVLQIRSKSMEIPYPFEGERMVDFIRSSTRSNQPVKRRISATDRFGHP